MPLSFGRGRVSTARCRRLQVQWLRVTASTRCPVQGESAIVVVPNGEIRLKEGSYVKEAKKLQLEFKPDPGDDKFILEESGFNVDEKKKGNKETPKEEKPQPKKPKGFL